MLKLVFPLFFGLFVISCFAQEELDNNPFLLDYDHDFKVSFSSLPLSGSVEGRGLAWPAFYWPNRRAVVANRWQDEDSSRRDQWRYHLYSKTELKGMSAVEINLLSPAEKYDIYTGRYDYPTVKMARDYGDPRASEWHGICHGMSAASLNHKEPATNTLVNADGIEVTFYSSDVKGLLGFMYATTHENSYAPQVGLRCDRGGRRFRRATRFGGRALGGGHRRSANAPECLDIDAGSFHIIMANMLGISGRSFIADIDRYEEVWNHSALDYSSRVVAQAPLRRAGHRGRKVRVISQLRFQGGISPQVLPVLGTALAEWEKRTYKYWLYLDEQDKIIGGKWDGEMDRKGQPDFLWYRTRQEFEGNFSRLGEVYKTDF